MIASHTSLSLASASRISVASSGTERPIQAGGGAAPSSFIRTMIASIVSLTGIHSVCIGADRGAATTAGQSGKASA